MRSDMSKVLVERPRIGHHDNYRPKRSARKHDLSDEAPLHESMRRPHIMNYEGKRLNENLRPLERFIAKQIGRPWNKVYSEINEHISVNNAVQAHIREHIDGMIAVKTFRDKTGRVWRMGSLWPMELRKGDLYVDSDGIIKKFKRQPEFKPARGMKVYAIYRARATESPEYDDRGYYYRMEFRVVEHKKMESEGVSADSVSYYFYAGTLIEAIRVLNKERGNNYQTSWLHREYVPQQNLKPKAVIS